ncbi:MAG: hypothetical protein JSW07_21655 [bacterium]|nr:MAG: hypothetical protein JSW07_21655 [bacterium]
MKKKVILLFFFLSLSVDCKAGIILPDDNFVPGWTTSGKTLRFAGSDLFNYINGGAELFHEFGFKELLVQGYRQKDKEIVLEVYQMENPEAALGIYLMKCGNETPIEKINARNSANKYQFTIVKESFFIQVNSFAGDERLIPVMTSLSQQTLKFIPKEKPVKIFDDLPKENLIPGSELIIRGPYGLQPIYTFGEGDILQLNSEVFGIVGDYKDPNSGRYTQIVIKYPNAKDASSAFSNLIMNLDSYMEITNQWDGGFIFKDFQKKFGLVNLNEDFINIKIKLSEKPIFKNR